jgi:O-antigen biosynthesis protein
MSGLKESLPNAHFSKDVIQRAVNFLHNKNVEAYRLKLFEENKALAEKLKRDRETILALTSKRALVQEKLAKEKEVVEARLNTPSWSITAPLRALRRSLLDPLKPKKEKYLSSSPAESLIAAHFHIDSPKQWKRNQAQIIVRGWCFLKDNTSIEGIRLCISERIYQGSYGLDRPDLKSVFPHSNQCTKSGFKIEAVITDADSHLKLQVKDEKGNWHSFFTLSLDNTDHISREGSYAHWIKTFDTYTEKELSEIAEASKHLANKPLISIIMPVYNTQLRWLSLAIDSIKKQTYPNWQLCIADDKSTNPEIKPFLEKLAKEDPRISVLFRTKNGHISEASNSCLSLVKGEYTCLFDHDDALAPTALSHIAAAINRNPHAQLIYTDEDKVDEHGNRFDPHFKPDWNPDLLTTQNYISHVSVYKTDLIKSLGGFRKGFEGSQDWDLVLRATEIISEDSILHIPHVLYHWRAVEGSTSLHLGEKNYTLLAGEKALNEHFSRTRINATVTEDKGGHFRPYYALPENPPLVSIIIPTRNAEQLVQVCISSILARTSYPNYEILLVDNNSDDKNALSYFDELRKDGVKVLEYQHAFNYSAITNFAVNEAKGDVLCLLNNDIEVIDTDWLRELVSHALRPDIGAVGAKLYYPDMTLQHAGVITGLGGVAGHAFKGFANTHPGTPQFRPHRLQNFTAVTAACLAIRKELFMKVEGFNAKDLTVAFNDVDFCLKVQSLGYRNLYTPYAELIHHESVSRGPENTPEKVARFQREITAIKSTWGDALLNDKAYNPNLTLDSEDFALAYPPRTEPLLSILRSL